MLLAKGNLVCFMCPAPPIVTLFDPFIDSARCGHGSVRSFGRVQVEFGFGYSGCFWRYTGFASLHAMFSEDKWDSAKRALLCEMVSSVLCTILGLDEQPGSQSIAFC